MDKYNELLSKISQKHHILKGNHETEVEWKTRIVYSICGMMGYASLWDNFEDPISLQHMKSRIRSTFNAYHDLYPELSTALPNSSTELEDEITNQFLSSGIVYHRPHLIVPSQEHSVLFDGVLFQRGITLDSISCVSGLGFYVKQDGTTASDNIKNMFALEREDLQTLWHHTIAAASWTTQLDFCTDLEFLCLQAPFHNGYWVKHPDQTGKVSILRVGMNGARLYYLYRYTDHKLEVSPLLPWQTENYNYLSLANACLASYGTLPPIEYYEDGALVHINLQYLLPPREHEFLKCYSWPMTFTSFPCNFKRKMSIEVFTAIKNLLSNEGYIFK